MTVKLLPTGPREFADLLAERTPAGASSLPETPIAPPEVLEMLAGVSAGIDPVFSPNAWTIVTADGCVTGLISLVKAPEGDSVMLGYGVAECWRGRGIAQDAVAEVLALMRDNPRVAKVVAETAVDNVPSQRVLLANGFAETGRRDDPEDGAMICWALSV